MLTLPNAFDEFYSLRSMYEYYERKNCRLFVYYFEFNLRKVMIDAFMEWYEY